MVSPRGPRHDKVEQLNRLDFIYSFAGLVFTTYNVCRYYSGTHVSIQSDAWAVVVSPARQWPADEGV